MKIDLELAVDALTSASEDGADSFAAALSRLAAAIEAPIAAAWRYNVKLGYFSCYARCGYRPPQDASHENVHPAPSSLLNDLYQQIFEGKKDCVYEFSSERDIDRHWAPGAIRTNNIKSLLAVPFYNHSVYDDEKPTHQIPTGLLIFYFKEKVYYSHSLTSYINLSFSQIYTNAFLRKKDELTSKMIEYFSKNISEDTDNILDGICKEIIKPTFEVEACSIYEWSALNGSFKLASTTGIAGTGRVSQIYDRTGDGLISVVAGIKKTISIPDIRDIGFLNRHLRALLTADSVFRHAEMTDSPAQSVLFVPVFNPVASKESSVTAVIKLVNKKLSHANMIDFFDTDDAHIAEEAATMIALHEEQSRSAKQQMAFALQFGHEAQAPAVGIRGTADRIMLKLERGELDQVPSMAQDIFDFSEMLIAFSESLTFGFGDRSLPKTQRYSFRQFNIRKAIDAARKVVIPICRSENLHFNDISVSGSYPLIFADQRAFMQVFYNLLTNAIKYRSRKEGDIFKIFVTSKYYSMREMRAFQKDEIMSRVFSRFSARNLVSSGVHVIDISDYGIGVSKEETSKVFIQGFRSLEAGSNDIRGSGIGLFIVRNILYDFDSFIFVAQHKDPTIFRIMIPDALESGLYSRRESIRRL